MEPERSMPHSQGLFNNHYPEPNQPNYPHWFLSLQGPFYIVLLSTPRPPQRSLSCSLPVKILKALLPSSILVTCPAHLNLLDLITRTILDERYKLWSSSLWSRLHSPFASLMGQNIRLKILFSNTLSLRSSLNIRDHVSQPYTRSTTGNIVL